MKYIFFICFILWNAQFSFSQFGNEKSITSTLQSPWYVETKDLDNDGDIDIVAVSPGTNDQHLFWLENLGGGEFSSKQIISYNTSARSFDFADFDLDGDDDIVFGAFTNSYNLVWIENLGNGLFSDQHFISNQTQGIKSVCAGDIDNDGDFDIATGSINDEEIVWYENNGQGSFNGPILISDQVDYPWDVNMADLDGDLDLDLMVADYNLDEVMWFENLGGGIFGSKNLLSNQTDGAKEIIAEDMNGDGDLDIVSASQFDDKVSYFENLGSGTFGVQLVIGGNINYANSVYAQDLDADLDFDLVVASGDDLGYIENLGGGTFASFQQISSLQIDHEHTFPGDIDGDGIEDVVFVSKSDEYLYWFKNNGGFSFTNEIEVSAKTHTFRDLDYADIDGDGDIDLASASSGSVFPDVNKLAWYKNLGFGKFERQDVLTFNLDFPLSVQIADVDGDALLDVVSMGHFDHNLVWFQNLGNGSFGPMIEITDTLVNNEDFYVIDLDGDLDNDIVVSANYGGGNPGNLSWYENTGGGNFILGGFLSDAFSSYIICPDLDNDGDNDIIARVSGPIKIIRIENLGGGNFAAPEIVSDADPSNYIATYDLDNDNDLDIVYEFDYHILYRENQGANVFGPPDTILTTPYMIGTWYFEDIDTDGDYDAIVGDWDNGKVYWYENTGGLNLTNQQFITNSNHVREFATFDVDMDNDFDLVLGSDSDEEIIWFGHKMFDLYEARGNVFFDNDENGIKDSADFGLNMVQIVTNPSGAFTFTDTNGDYGLNFGQYNFGNYQIYPEIDTLLWNFTTDSSLYHILVDSSFTYVDSLDFGLYPDTLVDSIQSNITAAFPSCGDSINYHLTTYNIGTTKPSGIISLELDDSITFVNAVPSPDSIVGSIYYWSFDSLYYFSQQEIILDLVLPGSNSEFDTITSIMESTLIDSLGNSFMVVVDSFEQIIQCQTMANYKMVDPIGADSLGYIPLTTSYLDYYIQFQNTGNDTVQTVIIKDLLDTNLDPQSLTVLGASFPPIIDVDVSGEIKFTLENINLPDSSINQSASQGWISYRVYLDSGLAPGTSIFNDAKLFFDQSPYFETNEVINTLYDCDLIVNSVMFPDNVCEGANVFGSVDPAPYNSQITWELGTIQQISGGQMNWPADTTGIITWNLEVVENFCSSDSLLNIEVLPSQFTNLDSIVICQSDSSLIFGSYQSTSGFYYDTLQTTQGCDSILTQELIVNPLPTVTMSQLANDTICEYMPPYNLTATPSGGTFSGSGVSGNTFDPSVAGLGNHTLYYTYTDGNNCEAMDSIVIDVNACLELENNPFPNLTIYPNPFSDFTTISFGQDLNGGHNIRIFDVLGKEVYARDHVSGSQIQIQKDQMGAGVYLFSIFDNMSGFEVYNAKLVVE